MDRATAWVARSLGALLTALVVCGVTVWLRAQQAQPAKVWLLEASGGASMALEPIRDAVQIEPRADPSPIVAELPGGYPVVAQTRPGAGWRGGRAVRRKPKP